MGGELHCALEGVELIGGDLAMINATTLEDCKGNCSFLEECYALTFLLNDAPDTRKNLNTSYTGDCLLKTINITAHSCNEYAATIYMNYYTPGKQSEGIPYIAFFKEKFLCRYSISRIGINND